MAVCMGFQCATVSVYYGCTSLSEKIQILSGDADVIAGGRDLVGFVFHRLKNGQKKKKKKFTRHILNKEGEKFSSFIPLPHLLFSQVQRIFLIFFVEGSFFWMGGEVFGR